MSDSVIHLPEGELKPQETVAELDKYIIGQDKAKRAVAIALRNRFRRRHVAGEMKEDIRPKNILMIGPTGVGKTEIARRLSHIARIPFIKIEATKFTEVGYVGRDVDSMVRDLVEVSLNMVKTQKMKELAPKAQERAHERLLDALLPESRQRHPLSGFSRDSDEDGEMSIHSQESHSLSATREKFSEKLKAGNMDDKEVEIEVTESTTPMVEVISQSGVEEMGFNLQGIQNMLGNMFPSRRKERRVRVREAREILFQEEMNRLLDHEDLQRSALRLAEESGMIFLDEIDKVASSFVSKQGPDVSREGVQRDLLPLVEGTTVVTKYGIVKTDHILFFAAGAFNVSKPSDLIPELQGRFPVRVEFDKLTAEEFRRILTEPRNALTRQYTALLAVDNVELRVEEEAIERIAHYAQAVNNSQENIGARRLHTIMDRLLDEVSFEAPAHLSGEYVVTAEMVDKTMEPLMKDQDLAKFIL